MPINTTKTVYVEVTQEDIDLGSKTPESNKECVFARALGRVFEGVNCGFTFFHAGVEGRPRFFYVNLPLKVREAQTELFNALQEKRKPTVTPFSFSVQVPENAVVKAGADYEDPTNA